MNEISVEKYEVLPIGWIKTKLEDCVEILDSKRIPINSSERSRRKGNVPYYGATGQVDWIDDYLFDEEIVLLGEDGAPFFEKYKDKAYVVTGKSWVNNHAHVLKGIPGLLENKFLCYYLNRFDYHGYVNGTTRLKLNQSTMKQIPILLGPINEQNRIVSKIEELFSKINFIESTLQRIKAELYRYRNSLFFNSFANILPLESLSTCGNIGTGGTPSRKKPEYYGGKIPWIKTTEVKNSIIEDTEEKITQLGIENSNAKVYPKNSVILAMYGEGKTRGRVAISNIPAATNQACAVIVCNSEKLYYKYCFYWLQSQYYQIRAKSSGGNQPNLNLGIVKKLKLPLPDIRMQKSIVEKIELDLSQADFLWKNVAQTLNLINMLKKTILEQAFQGKLVSQDENGESTEILLQKIRREKEKLEQTQKVIKSKSIKSRRIKNAS